MAIEGIYYVTVKSSDLSRAKRFYGETLGWQLQTDEPVVAGFAFGAAYLVVHLDADGAKASSKSAIQIAVKVSDIEAEHARLTRNGVTASPVQKQPWGEVSFTFADPDGYVWKYAQ